jgi:hypothetical protein
LFDKSSNRIKEKMQFFDEVSCSPVVEAANGCVVVARGMDAGGRREINDLPRQENDPSVTARYHHEQNS